MTYLMRIKDSAQLIAEAIAAAIKVDVQIVDKELNRIAITGKIKEKVGSKVSNGNIFRRLINEGEAIYLNSPRKHLICKPCPKRSTCEYSAGIFYPIKLKDGEVIGAISLEAFNDQQQRNICDSIDVMSVFLRRMADLVATKVNESLAEQELKMTADMLAEVVNNIGDGVIAVDFKGQIICCNTPAQEILGINDSKMIGQNINSFLPGDLSNMFFSGQPFKSQEISFKIGNQFKHLMVNTKPLGLGENITSTIITFVKFSEAKKFAFNIIKNQKDITFNDIHGTSEKILKLKDRANKIADSISTVLLTGESGTGKELFARAIHGASVRAKEPFITINCGAIPEQLLESELFGYERGAFTGARKSGKPGKFELADGGTIFLDEIGNMSLYMQAKLLRVLQEKEIDRIGATSGKLVDVRVIAATNANLRAMTDQQEFREDLYYRLNVIPIFIPPLRERREDILVLLEHFLRKFNRLLRKDIHGFDKDVLEMCMKHNWPGNVRELGNVIEYAVNIEESAVITMASIPKRLLEETDEGVLPTIAGREQELISSALEKYGYTVEGKEKAAQILGISRATLYRKLKRYRLS